MSISKLFGIQPKYVICSETTGQGYCVNGNWTMYYYDSRTGEFCGSQVWMTC
jgi:hypothetical protein